MDLGSDMPLGIYDIAVKAGDIAVDMTDSTIPSGKQGVWDWENTPGAGDHALLIERAVNVLKMEFVVPDATYEGGTNPDAELAPTDFAGTSAPRPTVELDQVYSSNVAIGATSATVNLSGVVRDPIADNFPRSAGADIEEVRVYLNGSSTPLVTAALDNQDDTGGGFWKQHPYKGIFDGVAISIPLEQGPHVVRVETSENLAGNTGYAEVAIVLEDRVVPGATGACPVEGALAANLYVPQDLATAVADSLRLYYGERDPVLPPDEPADPELTEEVGEEDSLVFNGEISGTATSVQISEVLAEDPANPGQFIWVEPANGEFTMSDGRCDEIRACLTYHFAEGSIMTLAGTFAETDAASKVFRATLQVAGGGYSAVVTWTANVRHGTGSSAGVYQPVGFRVKGLPDSDASKYGVKIGGTVFMLTKRDPDDGWLYLKGASLYLLDVRPGVDGPEVLVWDSTQPDVAPHWEPVPASRLVGVVLGLDDQVELARATATIAQVLFLKHPNHQYGFDEYGTIGAMYHAVDPGIAPGPPHDLISIEKGQTGSVDLLIQGPPPDLVYFTPGDSHGTEDRSVFEPDTSQIPQNRAELRLTAKNVDKDMRYLYARMGSTDGPPVARLGVHVYAKVAVPNEYVHFDVGDSSSNESRLRLNVDVPALRDWLNNSVYKQVVVELTVSDGGAVDAQHYDTHPTNGVLDLYAGGADPEWNIVEPATTLTNPASQIRVVHVHDSRYVMRISAISPDRRTVTLETPFEDDVGELAFGPRTKVYYKFEDWTTTPPVRKTYKLVARDPAARTVTLDGVLDAGIDNVDSGLVQYAAMAWGNNMVVADFDYGDPSRNRNAYRVYFAHEAGHTGPLGQWIDVAEVRNLMFGGAYDGREPVPVKLRNRPLPHYRQNPAVPDDRQWDKVPGR